MAGSFKELCKPSARPVRLSTGIWLQALNHTQLPVRNLNLGLMTLRNGGDIGYVSGNFTSRWIIGSSLYFSAYLAKSLPSRDFLSISINLTSCWRMRIVKLLLIIVTYTYNIAQLNQLNSTGYCAQNLLGFPFLGLNAHNRAHNTLRPRVDESTLMYDQQIWKDSDF